LDHCISLYVAESDDSEVKVIFVVNLEGKTILVAGYARTGQAVVEFLSHYDCRIVVSDVRTATEFPGAEEQYRAVRFEFGEHRMESFLNADLILLSPGIPDTIAPLVEARRKGIPIWSEIELAFHYLKGTLIGITGTNGKSTTTELAGAMLREGGKNAHVCGNIGTPLIQYCRTSRPEDYYVAEISSFQLETIERFRPHIAALINVAEDHLDRYPSVEPYFQAKMRMFENQKENDFAILNYDDPYVRDHAHSIAANKFWFSRKQAPPSGLYAQSGLIRTVSGGSVVNFSLGRLTGIHNLENTLCAASIALLCGVLPKALQRAVENFQGLHHRMELVAEIRRVRYYNDSKATNVDAVMKSLESFPGRIILIMGGKDKGCNYRVLRDLVRNRVKLLLLIGEARNRIAEELREVAAFEFFTTLEEAVKRAAGAALPGDVVLLSPACSSFDMFANYEERGNAFRAAVEKTTKSPRQEESQKREN
jgi:UDP-N-acetylmuramoylalanine--D-glutamate ligase